MNVFVYIETRDLKFVLIVMFPNKYSSLRHEYNLLYSRLYGHLQSGTYKQY